MKETMTKRFFTPAWKCEKLESELSRLEQEGWRLDKISGFRKFEFIKATPKKAPAGKTVIHNFSWNRHDFGHACSAFVSTSTGIKPMRS